MVNFGPAILKRFVEPQVPHVEKKRPGPCLTFLLEHPSGRKLVFDLGIRKDYENYAPTIANYIPTTMYTIEVTKNVADILEENDIPTSSIEAVIWSHWHWGHIGDPSTFPPSTDLIVGQGFKAAMLPGYPANPDSPIRQSDYERTRDQLVELDCDDDVFVIVAHDAAVGDQVAHFPETLNEWRQKGWADDTRWTFLRDLEPYWTAKTVALC
ncbi:hypothetical protein LTR06_011169 [Exophiala xenobiotica]|nr:hypothetical protein LTR06_011169 [Exophiala xenobiotica]